MARGKNGGKSSELREKAEKLLVAKHKSIPATEPSNVQNLIHELSVHQVELEIQNEELRQSQIVAEEARDRYLDLYDFAPVGYFTLDEHSRIIEANLTGCHMLQTDKRNIKNKYFARFISEDETDSFYLYRKKVMEKGGKQNFILKMKKADGTVFYAQLDSTKTSEARLRLAISDVSIRKKTEEALERSENHYRSLFENMIDGYALCHMIFENGRPLDFVYVAVNESFEKLTGLTDVAGKRVTEVIPDVRETNPELLEIYGRVALSGKPEKFEVYLDQLAKWFSISVYSPQTDYFVTVFENITARKNLENYQLLTSEVLGILNDSAKIGHSINSILSLIQRKTGIEAAGIRLLSGDNYPYFIQNGFTKDFLITENTLSVRDANGDVCRDKDGNISLECTCGLVLSGKTDPSNALFTPGGSAWTNDSLPILDLPLDQDQRLHPRNRCIHEGFQSIALIPIRANNMIVGLLQLNDRRKNCFTIETINFLEGLSSSIGVALIRKQAEDKINELNASLVHHSAQLEDVNKDLEAFSYSVSHDLRAPLRSINGFSKILLEDYSAKLDDKGREYFQRIMTSSQLMAQLIEDILNLSRLSRAEIHKDKVNLSELANEVVMELKRQQPDRHVEFDIEPGLEAYGDRHLLKLVFDNLLGNAFKFTGKVDLGKIKFGATTYNGELVYYIKDNGAGFDMAYADKLFKPFQRLHSQSEFPGTGIGLASVQNIIRRHGGKVWVEGQKNNGATFYFTLKQNLS